MAHGEINHIEFPADDPQRAKASTRRWPAGSSRRCDGHARLLGLPLRARARRRRRQARRDRPARSSATTSRSTRSRRRSPRPSANGGTVKEPKQEIPGMGWFAVVIDPEGNEVGLYQSAARGLTGRPRPATPSPMRLVDSHCHLQADRFDDDVDAVIAAARDGRRRADPRAWLERRLVGAAPSPSSSASRGSTPPSASIRTTRPRSTTTAGRRSSARRRSAGRGDRRDRARLRPGLLADPRPAREPPAQPGARPRDGQAGDPPLPVAERRARRPGRPARASCRAFGGAACRAAVDPLVLRPGRLRRGVLDLGLGDQHLRLAFRRGRGGDGRRRPARPGGSPPRRDRLAVPRPAGRAARPECARVGPRHRRVGRRATGRGPGRPATRWSAPTISRSGPGARPPHERAPSPSGRHPTAPAAASARRESSRSRSSPSCSASSGSSSTPETLAAAAAGHRRARARAAIGPRLADNGRVLLESYRTLARAIKDERSITPAAEWLVDNFPIVDEQLREIRDDLPPDYYRELPKLADGHLAGLPARLRPGLGVRRPHGQPLRSREPAPDGRAPTRGSSR